MKGRRKVKTRKWQMKAEIEAEAQSRLRSTGAKSSRFLDVALQNGREEEPLGRLAGMAVVST
jgi:hypothetical protein